MIDFESKKQDIEWISKELKFVLGDKIHLQPLNEICFDILCGYYSENPQVLETKSGIDFEIQYSMGEFLRLTVGEIRETCSYEEKIKVLKELEEIIKDLTSKIGVSFGSPFAFYTTDTESPVPHLEWVFKNEEEYAEYLETEIIYDDLRANNLYFFDKAIKLRRKIGA